MNEVEEIKKVIREKICTRARIKGHFEIAEVLENYLPKLSNKNIKWETGSGVTQFSTDIKGESIDFLIIQTNLADWLRYDEKVLQERLDLGKIKKPMALFSRRKYPIDPEIEKLQNMGFNVSITSGLPSTNISKKGITLYHVDDPFNPTSESRTAINITGKDGKKLVKLLSPIYKKEYEKSRYLSDMPTIRNIMLETLKKIWKNKDEMQILHELTRSPMIENRERIYLSIFFLQFETNDNISIKKIAKDTEIEYIEVKTLLKQEIENKYISMLEYRTSVDGCILNVKLSEAGMSKYIPRLLFEIIKDLRWVKNDIFELALKYKLPLDTIGEQHLSSVLPW